MGAWRDQYEDKNAIDAAGKLPGGERFQTVPEFRQLLVDRQDRFTRCLAEKLLTYALGRELEIGDRPSIDQVVTELDEKNGGLRSLVRQVVLSESFQNN